MVFNFETSRAACFQLKSDPEGCGWSRRTKYTEFFQERNRDNPTAESAAPLEPFTYNPAAASRMGCQPAHITDANGAAQGSETRTHTCCTKLGSSKARGALIGAGQPGEAWGRPLCPLPGDGPHSLQERQEFRPQGRQHGSGIPRSNTTQVKP